MIIWNFDTPLTLLSSIVWNLSEYFNIPLGKFAPIVFSMVLGKKNRKVK